MFGYRDAGTLGFNSALIGLALGKFYQLNTALWIMAPVEATSYFPETIASMRSILFSPVMPAGGLFLLGVLVSNWRHVIVTAGGLIAVALAIHVRIAGGAIDSGVSVVTCEQGSRLIATAWYQRAWDRQFHGERSVCRGHARLRGSRTGFGQHAQGHRAD